MSTPLLSSHLHVDGISKSYPDRRVLTDISFTVTPGEVVGLIGENGSGKTTLLKIIAGLVEADAGSAVLHASTSHARLGLLHQVPPFGEDVSVSAALEEAVRTSREAERELEDAAAALALDPEGTATTQRFGDALTEAERLDVWSTDQHISTTVNALGLANIDGERLTGTLSGGQRARLSLAWLLLNRPHALLLDEPTNHLDDSAVDFLRASLASWPGPVLLASHDRAFLDEVATVLIDLDPAPRAHALVRQLNDERHGGFGITRFTGSYSDYLLQRAADRERWIKRYRDEQDELKRLRSSAKSTPVVGHVDWKPRTESRIAQKFYGDRNARVVSRRIGEVERKLIELERDQVAKPPRPLHFAGLGAGADSKQQGIAVSAAGVTVRGRLSPVSFRLEPGEHLLVTGANGSGKSTLLAVLAGLLPPSSGEVTAPDARGSIGMLRQEVFLPDPHQRGLTRTATQAYQDAVGEERFEAVPLASFGLLEPRDLNRPLGSLSVGQQRRVELAALLADPPQLLLLDEPTNHLSLALATALEEQIPGYPGTVIVASHDRWLRARWQGRILPLEGA